MPSQRPPRVMWHCAVNSVHRQVAVASFLRAAQAAQRAVYYRDTDPMAPLFIGVAHGLETSLHVMTHEQLSRTPAFPATAVWIGSHEGSDLPWCTQLRALVKPPQVILCLEYFSPHRTLGAPLGHQLFVTGTPLRATEGHGVPSGT